ncbi:MAG: tRNA 2-thiouridine(34) synthase MnmA [Clostridia bacterium]|nr:tRNA 2-thiouridine(34) synthase MnmA [Clostridia bacterium]
MDNGTKPRVVVGMSGGVDSAVAAYLLKEQGYDVIGVTLRTWQAADGSEGRCCEIDDAAQACRALGIRHHAFNGISAFDKAVIRPFVEDYCAGLTPNPCVGCNRFVKWELLLHFGRTLGAQYVATGHYANVIRLPNGRYTVKTAAHAEKDQTYMLCRLTQEQLAATLMPLGGLTKAEVRAIAARESIPVADKPDSQEICFIPDGKPADFISEYAPEKDPGEGWFVDGQGNKLGKHKGITHYTIGQGKRLGIALGYHAYVSRIDAAKNEVTLGGPEALWRQTVLCDEPNWMGVEGLAPGETLRAVAKIRYHHPAAPAEVSLTEDGLLRIAFDEPVRAPAPGQTAVWYDDAGCVLGGGRILRAE